MNKISGTLRVLITDLTGNANGFEHQMSESLLQKVAAEGVDLASEQVLHLESLSELSQALAVDKWDFNSLLIIAHGARDSGSNTPSKVGLGIESSHWYEIGSLIDSLAGKLVCLAVCYGYCHDAKWEFVHGEHFAGALVAPNKPLSKDDVLAFFPPFFAHLKAASYGSIDTEYIERAVAENNYLARDRMRFFQ